jgi:hypothetical protein
MKEFAFSPNPMIKGQNLDMMVTGKLLKPIKQGAEARISLLLGPISVYTLKYDICKEIVSMNLSCPVPPGEYKFTKRSNIPSIIPGGHYTATVKLVNNDAAEILCGNADVYL